VRVNERAFVVCMCAETNHLGRLILAIADPLFLTRTHCLPVSFCSVSAGIPDFRTPGTGLYDNLQKYDLPYPEAVFDVDFYRDNPDPFCSLAAEIWPGVNPKHTPTLTHSFVGLLGDRGLLLRDYSQNIDGLEVR
jgi:hypothetical protein